jgi:glutamate-1-semialdehyde 2,1-aminomutase
VAGRCDILSFIEFRADRDWNASRRILHPGTFNANPLSAAAGSAVLSFVADSRPQAHADAMAQRLVPVMNEALEKRKIPGCVYGLSSMFHIVLGKDCPRPRDGIEWPWDAANGAPPPRTRPDVALALKRGCLNNGVDLMGFDGGLISAVHQPADIDATIEAFDKTLAQMQEDGIL